MKTFPARCPADCAKCGECADEGVVYQWMEEGRKSKGILNGMCIEIQTMNFVRAITLCKKCDETITKADMIELVEKTRWL